MRHIRVMCMVLVAMMIPAALLFAQTESKPMPMQMPMHQDMKPGTTMGMDCKAMMQRQDEMQGNIKAMDERLDTSSSLR